jgi:hypothetical protein
LRAHSLSSRPASAASANDFGAPGETITETCGLPTKWSVRAANRCPTGLDARKPRIG